MAPATPTPAAAARTTAPRTPTRCRAPLAPRRTGAETTRARGRSTVGPRALRCEGKGARRRAHPLVLLAAPPDPARQAASRSVEQIDRRLHERPARRAGRLCRRGGCAPGRRGCAGGRGGGGRGAGRRPWILQRRHAQLPPVDQGHRAGTELVCDAASRVPNGDTLLHAEAPVW